MDDQGKDATIRFLNKLIERVAKDEFYRVRINQERPMRVNNQGDVVRDTARPQTVTLVFEVVE